MKRMDSNLGYARLLTELAGDRELVIAYVKTAMENISSSDDKGAGLIALRLVAEAYGGLGAVSKATGVSRATVYRTLSADGNPRLDTLIALLRIVGLRLSVEESHVPVQLKALKPGTPKRSQKVGCD
jgi:probable addiction module antidote protein